MNPAAMWDPITSGLPRLSGVVMGFDTETRDPLIDSHGPGWCFPGQGEITGYAFAWGPPHQRHKMYLPVGHRGGDNLPKPAIKKYVTDVLGNTNNTIVVHNYNYDAGWCRREDIPVRAKFHDCRTAIPLLDEYKRSYRLDTLAAQHLGRHKNEAPIIECAKVHNAQARAYAQAYLDKGEPRRRYIKEHTWKPKADLWQMPGKVVGEYAADDAELALGLWEYAEPLLHADELWDIYQLESRLQPMLLEMRWRGVRVDLARAERAVALFHQKERELQKRIREMTGFDVAVWEADSIAKAFDKLGLGYGRTPKTDKPSFRQAWLETVEHPLAQLILDERRFSKTRGTFLEGYILNKHHGGRIYGQFHPLPSDDGGAVTGRFSSSDPNLENLPSPDKDYEMGVEVRGCYLPEEGQQWAACDYSQQEPRLMVHFAAVARVRGAAEAVAAYIANPRMDFHAFMAGLTGLPRKIAKNIFLGRAYGMGGAKYARSVGLPTKWIRNRRDELIEVAGDEAQEQLDRFNEYAPFVSGLSKECERRAKKRKYIRTLFGRKCRFNRSGFAMEGRDFYYKAMNRLIQGSAADQLKKAMLDLWDAGEVPIVPVHDELGCSVEDKAHANKIADVMVNCVKLRVPSVVDVELGPSWGATVKLEEAA